MKAKNSAIVTVIYKVRFTLDVDHPERRDASFANRSKPYILSQELTCTTHAGAVSTFKAILAGEYDFASEFIRRVEIYAIDLQKEYHGASSARTVRRQRVRDGRDQPWVDAAAQAA